MSRRDLSQLEAREPNAMVWGPFCSQRSYIVVVCMWWRMANNGPGPYAPAILRFQISFPPDYPTLPPSITFTSDIFHPLVAPLTTYTYTTGSSGSDTVSATDEERLSPGGFSLRHGFPHWFGRAHTGAGSSGTSSRNASDSYHGTQRKLRDAIRPPPEDTSSRGSSIRRLPPSTILQVRPVRVLEVLQYLKRSFDDESALDTLPLDAAGNSGAWKAWRAYRKSTNSNLDSFPSETDVKRRDEWSWDGVWEERVRKGIDASIAESTLFGGAASGGDDLVKP